MKYEAVRKRKLSDILCDNTNFKKVRRDVFLLGSKEVPRETTSRMKN